ncbi:hypothetical protein F5B18DRAFT_646207 [Nemania serpens]|nr:hypothetical protein F5B18DRAFT_646207 [Nemania serpens]
MPSSSDSPFRVVVVGAGVTGLMASHCLQKAGIDHIVLEKRDDVHPAEGASISIYPQITRVLSQLDCLETLRKRSAPHQLGHIRRPDGRLAGSFDLFQRWQKNHGYDLLPMERREFLRTMYESLPDMTRIRTGARIVEVIESKAGVEVKLDDGTVEKGDLVLGCDGVHSMMRSAMWEQMRNSGKISKALIEKDEAAFKIEWKCLIGIGPVVPGLGASDATFLHDTNFSFVLLAQPHCTFFFVLFLLDKPHLSSDRIRYTDADADALAASIIDHPITESVKFSYLWNNRTRSNLISLEEGVLERWYHGRIVLAGDAVHKATPNIALGGNAAMEDIVTLVNGLHRLLKEGQGSKPEATALDGVLKGYQAERMERAKYMVFISGLTSRIQVQQTLAHKAVGLLMPLLPIGPVASHFSEYIRAGPKLDFVDDESSVSGLLAWKDKEGTEKRKQDDWSVGRFLQLVGATSGFVMLLSAARLTATRMFGLKTNLD